MFKKTLSLAILGAMTALPAFAQDVGAPSAGAQAMIDAVRRGDTVVTSGGLIGKVTKVADNELTIELADGVRVRIVRRMVADVRGKGQLVPANDAKPSA